MISLSNSRYLTFSFLKREILDCPPIRCSLGPLRISLNDYRACNDKSFVCLFEDNNFKHKVIQVLLRSRLASLLDIASLTFLSQTVAICILLWSTMSIVINNSCMIHRKAPRQRYVKLCY